MGERARRAEDYFRQVAGRWDELRALYVHDDEVERQLAALIAEEQVAALLDIGTGTGRILEILADKVAHAVGIDLSPDMLMLARDRKSTRLNYSHSCAHRSPSSAVKKKKCTLTRQIL